MGRHATQSGERGQSLTELALLLPMLLLLILGTLDLVRIYDVYVSITNAAREGARYAAAAPSADTGSGPCPGTANTVTARVCQELSGTGIDNVTVTGPTCTTYSGGSPADCSSAANGDLIKVQVKTQYRFVTLFIVDQAHSVMDVSNSATMAINKP